MYSMLSVDEKKYSSDLLTIVENKTKNLNVRELYVEINTLATSDNFENENFHNLCIISEEIIQCGLNQTTYEEYRYYDNNNLINTIIIDKYNMFLFYTYNNENINFKIELFTFDKKYKNSITNMKNIENIFSNILSNYNFVTKKINVKYCDNNIMKNLDIISYTNNIIYKYTNRIIEYEINLFVETNVLQKYLFFIKRLEDIDENLMKILLNEEYKIHTINIYDCNNNFGIIYDQEHENKKNKCIFYDDIFNENYKIEYIPIFKLNKCITAKQLYKINNKKTLTYFIHEEYMNIYNIKSDITINGVKYIKLQYFNNYQESYLPKHEEQKNINFPHFDFSIDKINSFYKKNGEIFECFNYESERIYIILPDQYHLHIFYDKMGYIEKIEEKNEIFFIK